MKFFYSNFGIDYVSHNRSQTDYFYPPYNYFDYNYENYKDYYIKNNMTLALYISEKKPDIICLCEYPQNLLENNKIIFNNYNIYQKKYHISEEIAIGYVSEKIFLNLLLELYILHLFNMLTLEQANKVAFYIRKIYYKNAGTEYITYTDFEKYFTDINNEEFKKAFAEKKYLHINIFTNEAKTYYSNFELNMQISLFLKYLDTETYNYKGLVKESPYFYYQENKYSFYNIYKKILDEYQKINYQDTDYSLYYDLIKCFTDLSNDGKLIITMVDKNLTSKNIINSIKTHIRTNLIQINDLYLLNIHKGNFSTLQEIEQFINLVANRNKNNNMQLLIIGDFNMASSDNYDTQYIIDLYNKYGNYNNNKIKTNYVIQYFYDNFKNCYKSSGFAKTFPALNMLLLSDKYTINTEFNNEFNNINNLLCNIYSFEKSSHRNIEFEIQVATNDELVNKLNNLQEEINKCNANKQQLFEILKLNDISCNKETHNNCINDVLKNYNKKIHEYQKKYNSINNYIISSNKELNKMTNINKIDNQITNYLNNIRNFNKRIMSLIKE
ncbi:hypothetical protein Hokovirus_3_228 [Hokovirus HKV1]|uniref:Endonuclease/exonuclease/phosphatase family protein n=1 Tax=Hokovirus HKV1 TaxID=1977638 RepID=A0A1V0SGV6_9VIRU|nr:hypothetical protein Hokovirus_3_228 [Hokovirus HKV1]